MTAKPFQLMLVLNNRVELASWVTFAAKLLPAEGRDHEIHLRGLVSMEADKSLSEGALAAREWRDSLNQMALEHDLVHDEVLVHVDYQPFQRILEELNQRTIDLLVVEWSAALGQAALAAELRRKTLTLVQQQPDIYEYYHPISGERPPKAAPMFGWSAALFIELALAETRAAQQA